MNHGNYVDLLRPADLPPGGTWADLGAGDGAFTLALRELIGAEAGIYAVDRDHGRLKVLEREYSARFGSTSGLTVLAADFSGKLHMPTLDGLLMANSLHFFRDKASILTHVGSFLKPGGRLILVEYNTETGNLWVPHPLTFDKFSSLAGQTGYSAVRLLGRHSSTFLGGFYSVEAFKMQQEQP